MRLILAVLVLASIAAGARAQPQATAVPWHDVTSEGVLRTHVWTVGTVHLVNGETACEAEALGRNRNGDYAIRIRAASPDPVLIVARKGQPFYKVQEIKL